MNYVIQPISGFAWDASVKPRYDVGYFMEKAGWTIYRMPMFHQLSAKDSEHYIHEFSLKLSQGDNVLWQTPSYNSYAPYEADFIKAAHDKGAKVIALVHDVDYLRGLSGDMTQLSGFLSKFDCLITLSEAMSKILRQWGTSTKMIEREPWDYYVPGDIAPKSYSRDLWYAGNLAAWKTSFLDAFPDQLKINVFGSNPENRTFPKNVQLQGEAGNDILPTKLGNGFGLVWDGNQDKQNDNKYGTYLKYNWSHKLSAYLAAGIPIIAWKESHGYEYVKDHQIGIGIDSLQELPEKLNSVTSDQYNEMVNRIAPLAHKVRSGNYIKEATSKALDVLA